METSERTANIVQEKTPGESHGGKGYFTTIDAFQAFNAEFLDKNHCRTWVLWMLHGDEPHCPHCKAVPTKKQAECLFYDKRVCCHVCRRWFTLATKTFLAGSHLDYREIFLLGILLQINTSCQRIAEKLNIDKETVRLWRKKFEQLSGRHADK